MKDKNVKVEWCENWIKALFKKKIPDGGGICIGCFWKLAEKSGLYVKGTFGSPMSQALAKLVDVEAITDENGNFLYDVFRLKA